jgi:hypothetical protein
MKREKDKLSGSAALFRLAVMLLLIFSVVPLLTSTAWVVKDVQDVSTADELAAFDFSSGRAEYSGPCSRFIPESSIRRRSWRMAASIASDPRAADRKTVSCATCRLVLRLKAGQVYGINGDSATYAQKLWVDGKLLSQVGTVSETADGFVPKTCNYTVYFTAGDGPTVIVMQRSNFCHAYGDFFEVNLGPAGQITPCERQAAAGGAGFRRHGDRVGLLPGGVLLFPGAPGASVLSPRPACS